MTRRNRRGVCLAVALVGFASADVGAVTVTDNGSVETGNDDPADGTPDGDRPFFIDNYNDGTRTFTNPRGFTGTATPGVDSTSVVTGVGFGLGGDDYNGLPLGVTFNYGLRFTAAVTAPASATFGDPGSSGLGVISASGNNQLTTGEQLSFSTIELIDVQILDPLGLLHSSSVNNALWRGVRSNQHVAPDSVTVSTDAAQTQNVKVFDDAPNTIGNNLSEGVFGPFPNVYLTTTAGAWPLKSIGYQVDLNYELAAVNPDRRTYKFLDSAYEGLSTLSLADSGTTLTVNPVATGDPTPPTLAMNLNGAGNGLGIGVNSTLDDGTAGNATNERRIDGSVGEAIHISFDEDVSLESLTLENLNLNGSESLVLSFVSGVNPFAGLDGYTGEYTLGVDSLTYTTSAGGRRPSVITFGKNGQDALAVEAGTVLAVSANPANGGGFLIDMITALVGGEEVFDADFDNDGAVDSDDLATWQANFGAAATAASGDATGDGVADGADFLQWQREATGPAITGAVPEPAALGLALVAFASGLLKLRSRNLKLAAAITR